MVSAIDVCADDSPELIVTFNRTTRYYRLLKPPDAVAGSALSLTSNSVLSTRCRRLRCPCNCTTTHFWRRATAPSAPHWPRPPRRSARRLAVHADDAASQPHQRARLLRSDPPFQTLTTQPVCTRTSIRLSMK